MSFDHTEIINSELTKELILKDGTIKNMKL